MRIAARTSERTGTESAGERGEVDGRNIPHDVEVDVEVVVDDPVAHPDDLRPRNVGVTAPKLQRQTVCGFAHVLDQVRDGEAEIVVGVEIRARLSVHLGEHLPDAVGHVTDVNEVILRHTAPWPTRGCRA
jgi:hypothetical protein